MIHIFKLVVDKTHREYRKLCNIVRLYTLGSRSWTYLKNLQDKVGIWIIAKILFGFRASIFLSQASPCLLRQTKELCSHLPPISFSILSFTLYLFLPQPHGPTFLGWLSVLLSMAPYWNSFGFYYRFLFYGERVEEKPTLPSGCGISETIFLTLSTLIILLALCKRVCTLLIPTWQVF